MSVAALIRGEFPGQSLYAVLGVDAAAGAGALKKAYFARARSLHPDKNPDPAATRQFQALSAAHAILSDAGRRAAYDASGGDLEAAGVADGDGGGGGGPGATFADWYAHWRRLFPQVTSAAVAAFEADYRGSAAEEADVLAAYTAARGSMDGILERVPCSAPGDVPRFVALLHAALAAGRLPAPPFAAFAREFGATPADGAAPRAQAAAARAAAARAGEARREAAEADAMLADARAQYKKEAAAREAAGAAGALAAPGAGSGGSKRAAPPRAAGAAAEPSLEDLIRSQGARRAAAFDGLAAKYGGGGAGRGSRAAAADDDDDDDAEEDEEEEDEEGGEPSPTRKRKPGAGKAASKAKPKAKKPTSASRRK